MEATDIALLCILHPATKDAQDRCLEVLRKSAREYYRSPEANCKIWSYYIPSPLFDSSDNRTIGGLELYTTKQAFSDQLNDPIYFQSYRNTVERENLYSKPATHIAWYPVAGFAARETNAEPFGGVIVTNSRLVCKDREAVLDIWRPFSEWVRENEPGVLSYMAFTRPKAPKEILLFERFKDKKVLIDRRETAEHEEVADKIEALLEKDIINSTTYWEEVEDSFVSNVVGGQAKDNHKL